MLSNSGKIKQYTIFVNKLAKRTRNILIFVRPATYAAHFIGSFGVILNTIEFILIKTKAIVFITAFGRVASFIVFLFNKTRTQ